jgi:precorrin-8X/cobalt-precorrin-8 methylmutase
MYDYLKDPQAIYARSFESVREVTDLQAVPLALQPLVLRLVHACGMPDIVADLQWRGDPVAAACAALEQGAPVLVDCEMLGAGIMRTRLPMNNEIVCTLNAADVRERAAEQSTTRSAAAVELWVPRLQGAVVAIGNAPTALFRLLQGLNEGWPMPAAILGFPVGFVGAAESKQALLDAQLESPCVALCGRRGGSALAAAAVNACVIGTGASA